MSLAQKSFLSQNYTGKGFGYLYNYFAVSNPKFAPAGWAVPIGGSSGSDWSDLVDFLGGWEVAGGKLKETGFTHWNSPNTGAVDTYGFAAIGSGYREGELSGYFFAMGESARYWGLGVVDGFRSLQVNYNNDNTGYLKSGNNFGQPVRLMYTGGSTPTTVTDYDGNLYDVVVINSVRYTVQNWKCKHYNDGTEITKILTDLDAWTGTTSGAYCAYDNVELNI